ncbi:hypothetical protein [Chishuiella sp.]|uniref:hypothetical protein n=1 Tax=Chishuiella sp. TaxID=1969467 RepID=UPI0028AF1616|nr:hypothetical protein [Chishuiella sp.]
MRLEFNKKTIPEILAEFENKNTFEWQENIFEFLKNFENESDTIDFLYQKNDQIFKSIYGKKFVNDVFLSMNKFLNLNEGDKALFALSALENEGMILLTQAIIGKLDLFCIEYAEEIKIPDTGVDQNKIGFVIDYAIILEKQLEKSISSLSRINKIATINNDSDLFEKVVDKANFYSIIAENGYPIGIKRFNQLEYTVLDKINVFEDKIGNLMISSEYNPEAINSNKRVFILDNKFKFIANNEAKVGKENKVVNFDLIEEKLNKYIDLNFSVFDFPDKNSGVNVVTLVIESRFVTELNLPEHTLKPHETPEQIFYIGEFPKNNDKLSIRNELKQLLIKSNKS